MGCVEKAPWFADNYLALAHNLNRWSERAMRSKCGQEPKTAGMERISSGLSPGLYRKHPPPPPPSPWRSIHLFFSINCETVNFYRFHRMRGVREKTRRNPKKCG